MDIFDIHRYTKEKKLSSELEIIRSNVNEEVIENCKKLALYCAQSATDDNPISYIKSISIESFFETLAKSEEEWHAQWYSIFWVKPMQLISIWIACLTFKLNPIDSTLAYFKDPKEYLVRVSPFILAGLSLVV